MSRTIGSVGAARRTESTYVHTRFASSITIGVRRRRGLVLNGYSDIHYCSGEEIRAGDRVRCVDWDGTVVFVLRNQSFAAGYDPTHWSYLGRGFMVDYTQAGLVFSEFADEDVELVSRE